MKLSRKVFIASAMMLTAGFAFAQSEKESSVESEYLNDVDGDIIMTLAESDEYDNKLVAIQYLAAALDDGNTSDAVVQALDRLAGDVAVGAVKRVLRVRGSYVDYVTAHVRTGGQFRTVIASNRHRLYQVSVMDSPSFRNRLPFRTADNFNRIIFIGCIRSSRKSAVVGSADLCNRIVDCRRRC